MKAEFVWRVTSQYCTLLRWSGVLLRAELPFEYVNGPGPKFWYVPSVVVGTVVVDDRITYDEHIRLAVDDAAPLVAGSVILRENYDMLVEYLKSAGARLSDIKKEIVESEECVVQA